MTALVDRTEFRGILKEVVKCLRQNLDVRGVAPLTAEQVFFWLENVRLEDLQAVLREIDAEESDRPA